MQRHDSMVNPPIEGLLDSVDSKFRLVTVSAMRARQINSYFGQLGEGLGASIPPQVTSTSRKPLSIAFEELSAGKIEAVEPPDEPEEDLDAMLDAIDAEMSEHLADDEVAAESATDEPEGA
ncbi:MAG: DNA-directed RNA polymerase subunit omega [Actinomycetota bacterium]|nr:DNA-directed RNA polymerase subunit omega [Actinomycetota bacterium]MEC9395946.1 DNA-directed RNA polymerase subunit omega [Actinomycetota bacterium]MEE2957962.1 DNA-directed RNA polymerase subunit omega [Actinomycetota bacterium]